MGFQMRLTEHGADLLLKTHEGLALDLVGLQVGSGMWSEEERKKIPPAALKSVERNVAITKVTSLGKGASRVEGLLTNVGLETGFRMTELAVTAEDPDHGTVVYMAGYLAPEVANYLEESGRVPVEMPLEIDIKTAVGGEVRFIVEDRFVSASKKDVAKQMQEHNAADDAHPNMRAASPHLAIPNGFVGRVNEGETIGLDVSGIADNAIWPVEVRTKVLNAADEDVTADFNPRLVDDALMLTAPQVSKDSDFTAQLQTWRHGELASLWSTPINLTVVDVPVDSPTLTFPANHAVNIGETPMIRWTKGASDDPSKKYTGAKVVISRDLLRTVKVAESGVLGAVTEWTPNAGVINTNEHLYVSVAVQWGDTWIGWVTHDFFTSAQFQFIQAPQIIAPQQNSQVMWSGLKVVIATPVVEQGGTLQQDKIECEYKKGSEAVKTIRVDKAQLFVDLPTLERNADHSARVRVHDKVRGWSGWTDWRAFRTKNFGHGVRVDGGIAIGINENTPITYPDGKKGYSIFAPGSVRVERKWGLEERVTELKSIYEISTKDPNTSKQNTDILWRYNGVGDRNGTVGAPAANYCYNLNFEGCTDFQLPTKEELKLGIKHRDLIDSYDESNINKFTQIKNDYGVWSSSSYNRYHSWLWHFDSSKFRSCTRDSLEWVIPVRRVDTNGNPM
jgi:hypothetical protein